jgi:hypothetical protein
MFMPLQSELAEMVRQAVALGTEQQALHPVFCEVLQDSQLMVVVGE